MAKLTKEQIETIKSVLDQKGELPDYWRWTIFPPEKQEYELVYAGKRPEGEIIKETMAVPLQLVRSFNNDRPGWKNRLIFGDNLQTMKKLLEDPEVVGKVKLVYIDPPFSTRKDFKGSQDQKAYQDKVAGAEFIEFLRRRLIFLRELLANDGAIYVHLDTKKSHYLKAVLDEVFNESNFRNEIVWKRQSAHNDSNQCGAIHDTIFFYTKSSEWTWNEILTEPSPDYIDQFFDQIEPSTNRRYARGDLSAGGLSGGGYEYEFKGIKHIWRCPLSTMKQYEAEGKLHWPKKGVPRLKRYLDEFEGVLLQDVWNDIRVIHNRSAERLGYPTQKPETLLERIIRASSNPGDLILDAFAGSGTTLAVAEKLGRRWIGIDCGKFAIYTIQKRMLNLRTEIGNKKGKRLDAKPFALYNSGHYDFVRLKELPWEDWRFFALQLFECKNRPHKIGGLALDGEKKGAPVLVYNWKLHPEEMISEETIDDIHRAIGDKIGRKFYIIAPMLQFDFQQDYIDRDNIRYYALRIPYSVIHELHNRDFEAVLQAREENDINDIQESYGFSFMNPPEVTFEVCTDGKGKNAIINTKKFLSKAKIKGSERRGGMDTLAMLLVDADYDGKVFDLDYAFFGEQLEASKWIARFDTNKIGSKIMAIWVDHHGNDFKALIPRENFGLPTLE